MRALSAALATLGILLVLVGQTADAGITPDATVIRPLATHVEAPLPPVTALPAVPARRWFRPRCTVSASAHPTLRPKSSR